MALGDSCGRHEVRVGHVQRPALRHRARARRRQDQRRHLNGQHRVQGAPGRRAPRLGRHSRPRSRASASRCPSHHMTKHTPAGRRAPPKGGGFVQTSQAPFTAAVCHCRRLGATTNRGWAGCATRRRPPTRRPRGGANRRAATSQRRRRARRAGGHRPATGSGRPGSGSRPEARPRQLLRNCG
jgi:hypothetical protein